MQTALGLVVMFAVGIAYAGLLMMFDSWREGFRVVLVSIAVAGAALFFAGRL